MPVERREQRAVTIELHLFGDELQFITTWVQTGSNGLLVPPAGKPLFF
jgi:hypothetical protein